MIRIGIICPSEIALRRFLPALKKVEGDFEYVGVAYANAEEWFGNTVNVSCDKVEIVRDREREKAKVFQDKYGGIIFDSYDSLIHSDGVDAVYLPLPPALHHSWAEKTLQNGKHAFVEKPFTTSFKDSQELISLSKEKELVVYENYMFVFHNQLHAITDILKSGEIGDISLLLITF